MKWEELNDNLENFLTHIDSIRDTLPMTILLLAPYREKANKKFEEFIEENVKEIEDNNISLPYDVSKLFEQLSKNAEISNLATKIISESLFVSLISQYDSFLNKLLRILYQIQPNYINNSERQLTFSQLNEFSSIEAAREYVVEKEIETVLRKSHTEHFEYIESKLGIVLRKDLPIWQTFIEITERRNLLVHCDGKVSNQYLKICRENKCSLSETKINEKLIISVDYFIAAYECLYELGTKLTHTIWRKLIKENLEEADEQLNNLCYALLTSRQYKLADILLDFAHKQNKHFNDARKNYFIVNKALSQYLQKDKDKAKATINSKDWSATSDDFKLAHLILNENFDESYKLMLKIGKKGEVEKEHYKSWPLFNQLRTKKAFKDTFKEIFNEDYTVLEIPKRPIQEILDELIEKNPEIKEKATQQKVKAKK